LTAKIDGQGAGVMPEMDGFGRYKVLFPFDLSGRGGGKASPWIRMAQPFAGRGSGQCFPLSPGTEVLVAFEEGDPDRPVITGAVPDAATATPVNQALSDASGIVSRGGGSLVFGEAEGKQNVTLVAGSRQGSVTVAAGSPTVAAFHAGLEGFYAVSDAANSLVGTTRGAGFCHDLICTTGLEARFVTAMAAIRSAIETVQDGVSVAADSGAEVGTLQEAAKFANYGATGMQLGIPPVVSIARAIPFKRILKKIPLVNKFVDDYAEPPPDTVLGPGDPDDHVFSLAADENGAAGRWRTGPGLTVPQILTLLGIFLATPGRTVARDYTGAAVDLLTVFGAMKSLLSGTTGRARGATVSDDASYVSLLCKGLGAFSSRGTLILESAAGRRLGDDLRYADMRAHSGWKDLAAADGADPKTAVLLRGKIVRTLAQEASVAGTELVAIKSPALIRLASGPREPEAARPGGAGLADANLKLVRLAEGPPLAKGVSAEVLEGSGEGSAARMCCFDPAGAVLVLQGAHSDEQAKPGAAQGRRFELSDGAGALLRDAPKRRLSVSAKDGTLLEGGDGAELKLAGKQIRIAGKKSSLTLGEGKALFKGDGDLNGVAGQTGKLLCGAAGFKLEAQGTASLKAALVKFAK
jgi:phage baseplate assembly protein gpV